MKKHVTQLSPAVERAGALVIDGDGPGAVAILRAASEAGDLQASHSLGTCYRKGVGVNSSPSTAVGIWKRAADAGSTESMISLSDMYFTGEGVRSDRDQAISLCERAAAAGNPMGLRNLGVIFEEGPFGIDVDLAKAATYFRRAADQGEANAMFRLARLLLRGSGIEKDVDAAFRYFEQSSDLGDLEGTVALAYLCMSGLEGYQEDSIKGEKLYRKAAKMGEPRARETLTSFAPVLALGTIAASPGVINGLPSKVIGSLISRHQSGDWGDLDVDRWEKNDRFLADGFPIVSLYQFDNFTVVVSTESSRASTYLELLGEEYHGNFDFWTGLDRAAKLVNVLKFLGRFS